MKHVRNEEALVRSTVFLTIFIRVIIAKMSAKEKIVNTIQERKMKYMRKEEDVIIRSTVKI